jgi:ADP-heptose:LPS heptosyltransferase
MKIVEFNSEMVLNIDERKIKIRPKSMYLFSDVIWDVFKKKLIELITKTNKIKDKKQVDGYVKHVIKSENNIDQALDRFTKDSFTKFTNPIILRTGGIGDLIALSSLSTFIVDELKINEESLVFVSQEKYKAVFDWYKYNLKFVSYFAPITNWISKNVLDKNKLFKKYKTIFFEGVIENSNDNWFNVQFNQIGIKNLDQTYGRPRLRTTRINNLPSNIDKSKKSILINPRSTAIIRSMMFKDLYESVIAIIGDDDVNIYVHDRNISEIDQEYIDFIKDSRINVINAKTLSDFFLDAYDADLTMSVDTALLHFREGIEKPGIGLYGQFPYECRSLHYKYTLSFNIQSKCPHMPCFIHVQKPDQICPFQQDLIDNNEYDIKYFKTAPCTNSNWNIDVVNQITTKSREYLLTNLYKKS